MTDARPLREVFDALAGAAGAAGSAGPDRPAGDPAEVLAGSGHADLPDQLVAEAIVSYADTAPVEVAAHLAPFVTAHSAVPPVAAETEAPDPASGLDLLATAPAGAPADPLLPGDRPSLGDEPLPGDELLGGASPAAGNGVAPEPGGDQPGPDPDFGAGAPADLGAPVAGSGDDPFRLDFWAGQPEPDLPAGGYRDEPESASTPDEPPSVPEPPPVPAAGEREPEAGPEDGPGLAG